MSDESAQVFPGEYIFKIFGRQSPTFVERVSAIVGGTFGELAADAVSVRQSSGLKYLSVTIVVWVNDRSQLEQVYAALKAEPEVLLYI